MELDVELPFKEYIIQIIKISDANYIGITYYFSFGGWGGLSMYLGKNIFKV